MSINKIIYHNSENEEIPSPDSIQNKPGLHIAGTRLLKYTEEKGITDVVVPDTITEISRDCFKNCRHLKSIVITDSVTLISAGAFADCFSLESIRLPSGIVAIGDSLFQNCYMLREIAVPHKVRYIGSKAFMNCRSLKSISFPDLLKLIDQYAFENCTDLKEITLPKGTKLHNGVFKECTSLESAVLPKNMGCVSYELFYGCSTLHEVVLPEKLKEIESDAFYGCELLRCIDLPDSLEEIGSSAFERSGLESIDFPEGLLKIGDKAFFECPCLSSIRMPPKLVSVGYQAFEETLCFKKIKGEFISSENHILLKHKSGSEIVHIPGDVLLIAKGVFQDDKFIRHVVFPNGLHAIDNDAFNGCSRLESVFIPYSEKFIGERAFRNCTSITELEFSEGIESIGHWAFEGCTHLTEVKLPESLDELGGAAFENCTSLKRVIFPENKIIEFLPSTFFGCDSLKTIQLGRHRFKVDNPERLRDVYESAARLLIEKHFEYSSDERKYMIPLIVQIYMDSRMPEAEKYIKDNLMEVFQNLSYDGEYQLVESLLTFSGLVNLNTLGEMNNYFHKCHDEKMVEIIQNKMEHIHLMMDWERFFYSQCYNKRRCPPSLACRLGRCFCLRQRCPPDTRTL